MPKMDNVVATELRSKEEIFNSDIPGAFFIDTGPAELGVGTIYYICPCGCGEMNSVPVALGEKRERYWKWNGEISNVTLEPSIKRLNGCKFHGFLTKGVWSFAGDSGR